jgi:hypothetical protein
LTANSGGSRPGQYPDAAARGRDLEEALEHFLASV